MAMEKRKFKTQATTALEERPQTRLLKDPFTREAAILTNNVISRQAEPAGLIL